MVPRGYTRSLRDWAILGFAPSPPTPLSRVRGRGECERNAFQMQRCRGFHQPRPGVRGLGRGTFVPLTQTPLPRVRGRGACEACGIGCAAINRTTKKSPTA